MSQILMPKSILKRRNKSLTNSYKNLLPPISRSLSINSTNNTPKSLINKRKSIPVNDEVVSLNDSIKDIVDFNRRLVLHLHQRSNGLKLALGHIVKLEKEKIKKYQSHS